MQQIILVLIAGILTGLIFHSIDTYAYVFYEDTAAKNRKEGIICECRSSQADPKKWKGVADGGECTATSGPNTKGKPYQTYKSLSLNKIPANSCCVSIDTNPNFNFKPKVHGKKSNKRC
jgi:hypothetical protein